MSGKLWCPYCGTGKCSGECLVTNGERIDSESTERPKADKGETTVTDLRTGREEQHRNATTGMLILLNRL